jgi:hypothetical protein
MVEYIWYRCYIKRLGSVKLLGPGPGFGEFIRLPFWWVGYVMAREVFSSLGVCLSMSLDLLCV